MEACSAADDGEAQRRRAGAHIQPAKAYSATPPVTHWPQSLFLLQKHHKGGKSGFFSVQSLVTAKYRVCGH